MNRREMIGGLATVAATASVAAVPAQSNVWRIKLRPMEGFEKNRGFCHVIDAETGEDVTTRFPMRCAGRVWRSYVQNKPVKVFLYVLRIDVPQSPHYKEHVLAGSRLLTELVSVHVVGIEGDHA